MLYEKKNNPEYFRERMEEAINDFKLTDEDFFVDLKMVSTKEFKNLFEANAKNDVVSIEIKKATSENYLNYLKVIENKAEGDKNTKIVQNSAGTEVLGQAGTIIKSNFMNEDE